MIPFESLPGLPPLFLSFVRGEARAFFPDPPTVEAAGARAREIVSEGGDGVCVTAGQQAGLFTGPLLALTKAAAAIRTAGELETQGVRARGVFWIATEDHDLAEVARATVLLGGAPRTFRLAEPSQRSYQPTGRSPVPREVETILDAVAGERSSDPEALSRFREIWRPGKTYGQAFRETFEFLLSPQPLEMVDPLEQRWREKKLEFFRMALERADEMEAALSEVEGRLRAGGHTPQVTRGEGDFPAFLIEEGTRRKIGREAGGFTVAGHSAVYSAAEIAALAARPEAQFSPAALLRPVLASYLMPVAAAILGPSELAYHAQTAPLYELFALLRPVFLTRPHLFPRGARERRAMEGLALSEDDLFRAREAVRAEPPAVSVRLLALEEEIGRRLEEIRAEIESLDPTLSPVVGATAERASSAVSRLREKIDKAAERRDEEKMRRLELVENHLAPEGTPPDRLYTPLTYRCRFGPGFVGKLLESAECSLDGARFVDYE